jgi:hypothetical protein
VQRVSWTHDRNVNAAINIRFVGRCSPSVCGNESSLSAQPPSPTSSRRKARTRALKAAARTPVFWIAQVRSGYEICLSPAATLNQWQRFPSAASKLNYQRGPSKKRVITPFSTNRQVFPIDAHGGAGGI